MSALHLRVSASAGECGAHIKGVPLQRVPKKYRRTFWEKEELPRTPRGQPMDARGQAKASDDARAAEGRALKIGRICFNSLKQILRACVSSPRNLRAKSLAAPPARPAACRRRTSCHSRDSSTPARGSCRRTMYGGRPPLPAKSQLPSCRRRIVCAFFTLLPPTAYSRRQQKARLAAIFFANFGSFRPRVPHSFLYYK